MAGKPNGDKAVSAEKVGQPYRCIPSFGKLTKMQWLSYTIVTPYKSKHVTAETVKSSMVGFPYFAPPA